jgi:hypothetical protein
MKLRVISDGWNTRLETEDGQVIEGVTGLNVAFTLNGRPTVSAQFAGASIILHTSPNDTTDEKWQAVTPEGKPHT